jgi:hypothetical protein
MSDPIPDRIKVAITSWCDRKRPGQIQLNVSPDGKIVDAEYVVKEKVKA